MESDFETQAIATQLDLQKKINNQSVLNLSDIRYVAGIDLAYWKVNETEYAVCSIVVLDYNTHIIMEQKHKIGKIDVPYIPGCLSFRELPLILETIKSINKEPDVYLFDGNGYLHPRKMGIATHAGILLNKPSIGVAKSYYNFGNTTFTMPTNSVGSYTNIIINSELYGRVLRTKKDVKPVFISIGNNICLEESTELVMNLIDKESHYPLPIRYADIETRKLRKQYMEKNMY